MPIRFTAHRPELEKRKTPNEPNFFAQLQGKSATSALKNEPIFTPNTNPSPFAPRTSITRGRAANKPLQPAQPMEDHRGALLP